MNLSDLPLHAGQWLHGEGPHSDVVISSRIRLARNLAGFPFTTRAKPTQCHEILDICRRNVLGGKLADSMMWVDLSESELIDSEFLVERHLISRHLAESDLPRGVAISESEDIAIMVNEEDHLRMQVILGGMQLSEAYDQANVIDDTLEAGMPYAFSRMIGYLTACPTNVGTGVRVSVMLHLPALAMTGEIEKVRRAAQDMHLAVRGFYGEGTEAAGEFYQVSNQTTLGRSEEEILYDFQDVIIPQVIEYERNARTALADFRTAVIDDRIYRSWGLLTSARLLGSNEALTNLSFLRLGVSMGRFTETNTRTVNELLLLTQPAHMQKIAGHELEESELREFRATFVRERLLASN